MIAIACNERVLFINATFSRDTDFPVGYSATTKESRFFFILLFFTFCGISSEVKVI